MINFNYKQKGISKLKKSLLIHYGYEKSRHYENTIK
jgi:hypothetical protein